ncbi:major facilitator superfamily transport protein [Natronomonas moolapensis 8.8.11]|uniref:Major facilitator superfamily transport protein n=1 Tax=Natronomonas moolapensis (strain DSM 18674 / CECT 7526 / JCM 14361 / 8.8.11) TaxID=268739 RepID=M1XN64_NATM8|nr:MFS transporter [Natronomonas moolapensis]CCQ35324.1 major facilitator superfamily transport protein [Natronomonas moolapensis 8.8.11]
MDRNDRSIVGFLMAGHAMVHVYELSIPIFMTVWLLEFSTTAALLGTVVSVGYGLFGVGALPGGLLVDRYGSRTLVVACLAGMGVSFLLLSAAPGVVGIAAALGLWGLSASVYHPAGLTLISNGVAERGRGFAYHGMAGNAGIAGGPLAAAMLLVALEWQTVAILLAVPALVAAIAGLRIDFDPRAAVDAGAGGSDGLAAADGDGDGNDTPNRRTPDSLTGVVAESRALFTAGFALVFVIVSLDGLYYRGVLTFLPGLLGDFLTAAVGDVRPGIFAPDSPLAEEFDLAGYLYAGLLTVGIGGQYVGGRLTERVEPDRGLILVLSALATIAVAFVPAARLGVGGLLAASVVLGFTLFSIQPLTQATIAKYSVPGSRGLSFGYTYLAIFGVGALGAAVSGTVLTYTSASVMFLVLAGFAGVAAVLALVLVVWA